MQRVGGLLLSLLSGGSDVYSGAVWPFDEQRMTEASGSNGRESAAVGLITIVSNLFQHCSSGLGEPVEALRMELTMGGTPEDE